MGLYLYMSPITHMKLDIRYQILKVGSRFADTCLLGNTFRYCVNFSFFPYSLPIVFQSNITHQYISEEEKYYNLFTLNTHSFYSLFQQQLPPFPSIK